MMENWIILSKLFIITYIIIKSFVNTIEHPVLFVLFILLYICINMVYYIVENKIAKTIFLLSSILILVLCYLYINRLFILLLPVNLYEFDRINLIFPYFNVIISGLLAFLFDKTIVSEYVLIAFMTYLIYILVYKSYKKIENLKNQNDELRKSIYSLYNKIDKSIEHEKQVRYTAQLEERNKISQKIHDSIGHAISGSLMQLEAAKVLMDKDKDHAQKLMQNVIDVLRDGLESIRIALRDIKPPVEQMGINRVKLIVDEFMVKSHIETSLICKGSLDKITYAQWNIIVENLKEALTNVLRYAKASKVTVSIEVLNKFIKTQIKDNGIGSYTIKKGLGLMGIEERSESMGGKVIIDGSMGFTVIFLLPLEEGNSGD